MSTNAPFLTKTFSRLKEINRLGHGYLFFGESAQARNIFAGSLLHFLEIGSWGTAGPMLIDGLVIAPHEGTIGIDASRSVIEFLSRRPLRSFYRAVSIIDAETLTREAQNALLKIVEEPPAYGIIFCSARDPELLLPALVSRLARMYVASPADLIIAPVDANLAGSFLAGAAPARKVIIKNLMALENDSAIASFIAALTSACRKDLPRHHAILKELLHRNALMARHNTNRKLQLETLLDPAPLEDKASS